MRRGPVRGRRRARDAAALLALLALVAADGIAGARALAVSAAAVALSEGPAPAVYLGDEGAWLVSDVSLDLASTSWTLECWAWRARSETPEALLAHGAPATGAGVELRFDADDHALLVVFGDEATDQNACRSQAGAFGRGAAGAPKSWHHWAVTFEHGAAGTPRRSIGTA